MFEAVQPVLDEIIPIALEAGMWSDSLQMAGQVDCVGVWGDELAIIDFKTSSKPKEEYITPIEPIIELGFAYISSPAHAIK